MKRPIDQNNAHYPFRIPERYFEDLKEILVNKTATGQDLHIEGQSIKWTGFVRKHWLPLAASLIILLGIAYGIWNNSLSQKSVFTDQLEINYPESTDDLFAFVSDIPTDPSMEIETTLEAVEDFLWSLELLEE